MNVIQQVDDIDFWYGEAFEFIYILFSILTMSYHRLFAWKKFAILSLLFPAHIHFSGHISLPLRVESVSVSVRHSIKQTNWWSGAYGGSSFTFVPFNLRFSFDYRMRRDVPTRVESSWAPIQQKGINAWNRYSIDKIDVLERRNVFSRITKLLQ